eukprot:255565_1
MIGSVQQFGEISLGIIAFLLLHRLYCVLHRKFYNYPPAGSYEIPLIGSISSLSMQHPVQGPVELWYIFGQPIIRINNLELYQQGLNKQSYRESIFTGLMDGKREVSGFDLNGNEWHQRRKVNHECLKLICKSKYIDSTFLGLIKTFLF